MAKTHLPPTAERLKELLHYEPETGVFTWRMRRGPSALKDQQAGAVHQGPPDGGGGYRYIGIDGKDYLAHRLAWLYMTGSFPPGQLDHRDTVRDNNWFDNLRLATAAQNGANARRRPHNTTGYKGVSFNKHAGRYIAYIGTKYLGLFDTAEAAHEAYCAAAREKYGDFFRPA